MKKIRTFGFVFVTAASIVVAGSGLAMAADKPPLTGSGTGSAEGSGAAIDALLKGLLTGSSAGK
ncbi:hypothetical protein [Nocardia brasiliensis]|uniref:hypothetical protein n=1 Tax=Nocardia brasiliensis TaxID=37326 RepID=UPI00366AC811